MKCDISKCNAACCYNVPIDKGYFTAFKNRITNKVVRFEDAGNDPITNKQMVLPVTNEDLGKNKCPFLRNDCKCNIYENRPKICRIFGDEKLHKSSRFLACEHLGQQQVKLYVVKELLGLLNLYESKSWRQD